MTHLSELKRLGLFDARAPRFTSYPPANLFEASIGPDQVQSWQADITPDTAISLYVHIPFCKHLCWFCACRTQGLKNEKPLTAYVTRVLSEAQAVAKNIGGKPKVGRLHLGGGTPTILPPALLDRLLGGLRDIFDLGRAEEFAVEIDPTDVDTARLEVLTRYGLNRASFGVQDFEPQVQQAIGRLQSAALTTEIVQTTRDLGVTDINFDLLYGLPHQTRDSLDKTLDQVLDMSPNRIALFGYAHVPWVSKRQILIASETLPSPMARYDLAEFARIRLLQNGYMQIGIDHFARPFDKLALAHGARRLRRSFQGYTDDPSTHLIALGASGVSKYPQGFAQNQHNTGQYSRCIDQSKLATARGYAFTPRDVALSQFVEQLMCYFSAELPTHVPELRAKIAAPNYHYAQAVTLQDQRLSVKPWARPLVRMIAADLAMDANVHTKQAAFSQAV